MTSPLLRPPDWTRNAACDGHPQLTPDAWDHCTPEARAICARCPVRLTCALDALTDAEPRGLWGGLDPHDRAQIAHQLGFDPPGLPPHGTRSRYGHRTHPCRQPCCREAMRRWKRDYLAGRPADTSARRIAS